MIAAHPCSSTISENGRLTIHISTTDFNRRMGFVEIGVLTPHVNKQARSLFNKKNIKFSLRNSLATLHVTAYFAPTATYNWNYHIILYFLSLSGNCQWRPSCVLFAVCLIWCVPLLGFPFVPMPFPQQRSPLGASGGYN
jgi:hypothetical protein